MASFGTLQTTIQSTLAALSVRERRLVIGGGAVVIAFLVFFVTLSFSNTANAIRNRTTQKLAKLDEVLALTANYRQAKAAQEAAERQLAQSNIKLLSYVEDNAKQKGLDLPSVTPKAEIPVEGTKIVENSAKPSRCPCCFDSISGNAAATNTPTSPRPSRIDVTRVRSTGWSEIPAPYA